MRKVTFGDDPLSIAVPEASSKPAVKTQAPIKATGKAKKRMTVHLTHETIDRLNNAVFWTPGESITDLVERAISAEIDRLESVRGESFPPKGR